MNMAMQDWTTPPGPPPPPPNQWAVIPMRTMWDAGAGYPAPGSSIVSGHFVPTWTNYGDFVPRGAGGFPASSSQYTRYRPYNGWGAAPRPRAFRWGHQGQFDRGGIPGRALQVPGPGGWGGW